MEAVCRIDVAMKKIVFVVICWWCSASGLFAQINMLASFSVTLPDTSGGQFFRSNPDMYGLFVGYEDEKPISISLYRSADRYKKHLGHIPDEYYDLQFEGDKYLLEKRHYQIHIPVLPVLNLGYLSNIGDLKRFKTRYAIKAAVYKDSIAYVFDLWSYPDTLNSFDVRVINTAQYKGKTSMLSGQLEAVFRKKRMKIVTDSVVVFRGKVHYDGSLSEVELIGGQYGPFSEVIRQGLEESGKTWLPGIQGGRPVRSYIRIYARLQPDNRIAVDVSGRNGQK